MGEARRKASRGPRCLADEVMAATGVVGSMVREALGGLASTRRWVLDAGAATSANEAAYGDMSALETTLRMAEAAELPLWFEYETADRAPWYEARGLPFTPAAERPEAIGVLATRDAAGRLRIDYAFRHGARLDCCPVYAAFDPPAARERPGEMKAGSGFSYEMPAEDKSVLTRPERDAYRAVFDRIAFGANAYGEAYRRTLGRDAWERDVGAFIMEAKEEAFFALGVIAVRPEGPSQ